VLNGASIGPGVRPLLEHWLETSAAVEEQVKMARFYTARAEQLTVSALEQIRTRLESRIQAERISAQIQQRNLMANPMLRYEAATRFRAYAELWARDGEAVLCSGVDPAHRLGTLNGKLHGALLGVWVVPSLLVPRAPGEAVPLDLVRQMDALVDCHWQFHALRVASAEAYRVAALCLTQEHSGSIAHVVERIHTLFAGPRTDWMTRFVLLQAALGLKVGGMATGAFDDLARRVVRERDIPLVEHLALWLLDRVPVELLDHFHEEPSLVARVPPPLRPRTESMCLWLVDCGEYTLLMDYIRRRWSAPEFSYVRKLDGAAFVQEAVQLLNLRTSDEWSEAVTKALRADFTGDSIDLYFHPRPMHPAFSSWLAKEAQSVADASGERFDVERAADWHKKAQRDARFDILGCLDERLGANFDIVEPRTA
jgi:hypothetical protein